jgi:hypothetical protein
MPGRANRAERTGLVAEEICTDAADAVFDEHAGLFLRRHQSDAGHQKHEQNLGYGLHDAVTSCKQDYDITTSKRITGKGIH